MVRDADPPRIVNIIRAIRRSDPPSATGYSLPHACITMILCGGCAASVSSARIHFRKRDPIHPWRTTFLRSSAPVRPPERPPSTAPTALTSAPLSVPCAKLSRRATPPPPTRNFAPPFPSSTRVYRRASSTPTPPPATRAASTRASGPSPASQPRPPKHRQRNPPADLYELSLELTEQPRVCFQCERSLLARLSPVFCSPLASF